MNKMSFSLVIFSLFIFSNTNYPQVCAQERQQFQNFGIPNRLFPFTASQFFQQPAQFVQRLQRQFFGQQNGQNNVQQPQQQFVNQNQNQNRPAPQPNQVQSNFQQPPPQQQQFQQFQNFPQQQLQPPRNNNNGQSFNQIQQQPQFQQQQQQPQFQQPQQPQIQQQQQRFEPMTEVCLACICEASTSCNLTTQCVSEGQYCGPFLISKPYWLDAGQPTLLGDQATRPGAFEDCAADPVCSAQTVRTYMTKYMRDCNGDGIINCIDLASIHLMGSSGCVNPSVRLTPFFQRFSQCFKKASSLSI